MSFHGSTHELFVRFCMDLRCMHVPRRYHGNKIAEGWKSGKVEILADGYQERKYSVETGKRKANVIQQENNHSVKEMMIGMQYSDAREYIYFFEKSMLGALKSPIVICNGRESLIGIGSGSIMYTP